MIFIIFKKRTDQKSHLGQRRRQSGARRPFCILCLWAATLQEHHQSPLQQHLDKKAREILVVDEQSLFLGCYVTLKIIHKDGL